MLILEAAKAGTDFQCFKICKSNLYGCYINILKMEGRGSSLRGSLEVANQLKTVPPPCLQK